MIVALALVMGCGSDKGPTAPDAVTFAGIYSMQSVNGNTLPYVLLQQGTTSYTVTDAHMNIASGGSWTEVVNLRQSQNGVVSTQTTGGSGTWLRSGNALAFTSGATNATYYTGTFSDNRLDLTDGTVFIVYVR